MVGSREKRVFLRWFEKCVSEGLIKVNQEILQGFVYINVAGATCKFEVMFLLVCVMWIGLG